ncbi:MAG: AAA family ATPase [Candidatus Woesearchaeota archaeon]
MIITICGSPGSGKDTVANLLLEKILNQGKKYEMLSIGDLRRIAASEKNMTLEQFNEWSTKNPKEGDEYFDDFQREHAKKTSDFILVSRLGWYLIPHSYKIYVDVDPYEGARRIYNQKLKDKNKRNEYDCKSIEEQVKVNSERTQSDITRYMALYNANPYNLKNHDLIINSTKKTPNEVVIEIFEKIQKDL